MAEVLRCGSCTAPLHTEGSRALVTCEYCGAQTRIGDGDAPAAPSGPKLAETVALAVSPTRSVPLLASGVALPAFHSETLSTSRDDQDTLTIDLVAGDRPLVSIVFAIEQRKPRGVPQIQLTVRVTRDGAASITIAEKGTTHAVDRDGLCVATE